MANITFTVAGMSCNNCVKSVSVALAKLSGVINYDVSLETKKVNVVYDENKTNKEKIVAAVEDTGFEVTE